MPYTPFTASLAATAAAAVAPAPASPRVVFTTTLPGGITTSITNDSASNSPTTTTAERKSLTTDAAVKDLKHDNKRLATAPPSSPLPSTITVASAAKASWELEEIRQALDESCATATSAVSPATSTVLKPRFLTRSFEKNEESDYDEYKEHKEADEDRSNHNAHEPTTGASYVLDRSHPSLFDETSAEGVLIQKAHQEKGEGESVVLYNQGATELFRSIEEVDWDRALRILQKSPHQASVWVVSTGTINTTFNWSLWKRLPLHEAARRQAPPDFLTLLIRAHPAAVQRVTQFGELPLHLAVECGAAPAVVNLLAVHHWMGCHTTDQSGRTPFDILQEAASLLDPEEHKAVYAALHASVVTYQGVVMDHAKALQTIQEQHATGLAAVRRQHDADLVLEQEEQDKLLAQVTVLSQQLTSQTAKVQQQQVEVQHLSQDGRYWKDRVEQLQLENARLKQALSKEEATATELRGTVATRDAEAVVLADRIVDLQTAMTRLAHWHQSTVQTQLAAVNKSFKSAMTELSTFTTTLTDHEEDLQTLLFDMGVEDDLDHDEQQTSGGGQNANGEMVHVTPDKHGSIDEDDMRTAQEEDDDDEAESECDDEQLMRAVLRHTTPPEGQSSIQ